MTAFDGMREHHEPLPSRVRRGIDRAVDIAVGAVLAAVVWGVFFA